MTAPTKRPPFEPPAIANFSDEVYFSLIRYSAAAIQSSHTFCFFSLVPDRCQFSPYSPPPRKLATAYTPPCSNNITCATLNAGVKLILKPPYAYSIVGLVP